MRAIAVVLALSSGTLAGGTATASSPGQPGLIAYVSGSTGGIRVVQPDGRHDRPLAPRLDEDQRNPAWSPGGRWLLYTANGLWIVRPDDSGRRRIARHGSDGSWSPDGTRIVFVGKGTRRGCTDIYSMRLNGKGVRMLTATSECELDPSFSPDGKWIVFHAQTSYAGHLVVAPSNGSCDGTRVIGSGVSPDWSPDGAAIAFASGTEIHVVDPSGRPLRELELAGPNHFQVGSVAWSPDGAGFVFAQMQATRNSIGIYRGGHRIYRADGDGSNRRELTVTSIDNDVEPAWQPVRG